MGTVENDTAAYHNQLAKRTKAEEQIQERFQAMKLSDLMDEVSYNTKIENAVWLIVRDGYRAFEPRNEIDGLLEDLYRGENRVDFVCHLGLEDKIKEYMIEYEISKIDDDDL